MTPCRAALWGRLVVRPPVHVSLELTRPYTSRPSFAGRCKLAADVYRAGTHGRAFDKKPQTRVRRVPSKVEPCQELLDVYRLVR